MLYNQKDQDGDAFPERPREKIEKVKDGQSLKVVFPKSERHLRIIHCTLKDVNRKSLIK